MLIDTIYRAIEDGCWGGSRKTASRHREDHLKSSPRVQRFTSIPLRTGNNMD
jgi:hypothetical protein